MITHPLTKPRPTPGSYAAPSKFDWFADDAFCDAFGDQPLGLTDRRALACVCKRQRDTQAHYFLTQRVLRVYPADCTQANAEFIFGGGDAKALCVSLQVDDDVCLLPMDMLCQWYAYQDKPVLVPDSDNLVAAFFLGRFFAHHSSGTMAFRMPPIDPYSDDEEEEASAPMVEYQVGQGLVDLGSGKGTFGDYESDETCLHLWQALAGVCYEAARRRIDEAKLKESNRPTFLDMRHLMLDDAGVNALRRKINDKAVVNLHLGATISPLSWGLFRPLVRGEMFPLLEVLRLDENHHFCTHGTRMLTCAAQKGALPRLRVLSLEECGILDEQMQEICKCFEHLRDLTVLNIGRNLWGNAGLHELMTYGPKLTNLINLSIPDLEPKLTSRILKRFAAWIEDGSGWRHIESVRLCCEDDLRPGEELNPEGDHMDWEYQKAADAVDAAVKFCVARKRWEEVRPDLEFLV